MSRILIVEDDPAIALMVRDNLVYEGYEVECVTDGRMALAKVRLFSPDLILLDLMLPGLDGYEICRAVSEGTTRIPVIMLTARSQNTDKIQGFEVGADDYITKPFVLDELLARIRAVLRRTTSAPEHLDLGDLHIDFSALKASRGKKALRLTQREYDVLHLLWMHRGKVVSRDQLLRSIWGFGGDMPVTRAVDHFIARLRSKIEADPHHPRYLHTVYGDGYRLTNS